MQDSFSNVVQSAARPLAARVVCLVGFMGSGKTTVGQLLARQLAWRFEDLDARIEQSTALTIPEIFERFGETAFRQMEAQQLEATLGRANEAREPVILALGGGTFAQPGVADRLRAAGVVVVWLDCPVELLFTRCAIVSNRPLFRDESSFRQLLESRLPSYRQADFRVEGDDEPARVVERILALPPFTGRIQGFPEDFSAKRVRP